ncbi:leucine dehydrogenase [Myxococcus stipitatus]|uniref:Leu/Phe/Val dehydrogenase n=1 Tax=Myxococcus stipitatus TaxID=83455 RepID=UPI003145432B
MSYFTQLLEGGYEAVHLLSDSRTGLKAIVGMHNTRLGPGLGGTRALSTYTSEEEAVADALRLARGMTYKAALAGLPHGGGKAVIMLPRGNFDRAKLFESFGRAVESLCGRYITTEDSGTSPDDMEHVRKHTKYVLGLKERSGDPSPVTAFGVARAMEATAKHLFGSADLKGLRVTVLGVGHVGMYLVKELHERGAKVWVSDINAASVEQAVKNYGATAVDSDTLHRMEADIFAPCALGGGLNDTTLPLLKVKAVCGAANNQLLTMRHGEQLANRGILYVPDYAANAGGLINVAQEWAGYDREKAYARASNIFDTIDTLLRRAKESGQRPEQVADRMVEEKLSA